jgi:HD superfamily phosphohydrolase
VFTPSLFDAEGTPIYIGQAGLETGDDGPRLCYSSVIRGDDSDPIVTKVRSLATTPLFYRLNYIRQLSTTNLAINLDGTHNRLSHCLGTLDIASRILATLRGKTKIEEVEAKAVLVYALVHDCFHGPLGHTLDLIRDVIWGAEVEERIDKHLLLRHIDLGLNDHQGPLWTVVLRQVCGSDVVECERIFKYIESFLVLDDKSKGFLAEIVDSDLDSDRIDYIWRDQVHLTMRSLNATDIDGLISTVSVVEADGERHLAFSRDYAGFIEDLLDLRVKFYRDYYEHPVKQVADEMLAHAIYYVLSTEGILDNSKELQLFSDQFSLLTDDGLFAFMTETTSKAEHELAYFLFEDFRSNRPFRIIDRRSLHRQNLASLSIRIGALNNALKQLLSEEQENIKDIVKQRPLGIFDRSKYESVISRFNEKVLDPVTVPEGVGPREWAGSVIPYAKEEDIYFMQVLYGDGFKKKLILERILWNDLLRRTTGAGIRFEDALLPLVDVLEKRGFHSRSELREIIKKIPLVFITLAWIPGVSEEELLNHQRGYRQNSIRFHKNGVLDPSKTELTVKARDEDYHLILSAPSLLLKARGMEELIIGTFDRLLTERKWVIPKYLEAAAAAHPII